MRVHKLTDITISSIKPPATGQVVYKDPGSPLQLRVSSGGSKTFYVVIAQGKRHTIGRYGEVTLAQARDVARRIRAEKTLGKYQRHTISWEAARARYLEHAQARNRPRTYKEYERLTGRFHFTGSLHDVTKHDVAQRLSRISALSERGHALVALRILFRWAISRGYLELDPTAGLEKTKSSPRARLLTDSEIRAIWHACERRDDHPGHGARVPAPFATIVKLLILTGQRRAEIVSLQAAYIKDRVCTLPKEITKNGREHAFPLSSLALSILPTHASGLLFPARGKHTACFSGWSKAKRALDSNLAGTVGPWRLHDLRRYYSSTMARLGVRLEVTERLLNHVSGTQSGVAGIYNRHTYFPEMREAVDLYERHIQQLIVTG